MEFEPFSGGVRILSGSVKSSQWLEYTDGKVCLKLECTIELCDLKLNCKKKIAGNLSETVLNITYQEVLH